MTASASLPARMGCEVRLYSRPGNDLSRRFPPIVETLARLRTCIIDGEAVAARCSSQKPKPRPPKPPAPPPPEPLPPAA